MAIEYNTGDIATGSATNTLSFSLTPSGSDRLAVLFTRWFSGTYNDAATCTVGGSNATQIGTTQGVFGDSRGRAALYYFIAPATSAATYAVTWTGNVDDAGLAVAIYTGVDQTTPINGSLSTDGANGTAASITVSSATGELVVAGLGSNYPTGNSAPSATGGQTVREVANNWGGGGSVIALSDEAGAASVVQSYTISSGNWGMVAARLNAATSGPSFIPRAMLLGVG